MQVEAQREQAKENAKAEGAIKVKQTESLLKEGVDENRIQEESEARTEEIVVKITEQAKADIQKMLQDHELKLARMNEEQRLEIEAAKLGVNASVQTGGNSINSSAS